MKAYTSRGEELSFNDHVVAEMLIGVPDEKRTGRLVQVRIGAGDFGSDMYLLRLRDGSLISFHNVLLRKVSDKAFEDAFYRQNQKEPPVVPDQPIDSSDSPEAEYSIGGKFPEAGFVIQNPKHTSSRNSFTMFITKP